MKLFARRDWLPQSILFTWALLCVSFFYLGVGRQSGIHLFYFENWRQLLTSASEINIPAFLRDLISSWVGMALFCLSVLGTGMCLLKWTHAKEEISTAFVLGQGIYSSLFLISIATTHQLSHLYTLSIFSAGLILALTQIRPIIREIRKKTSSIHSLEGGDKLLVAFCISVLMVSLFYSSSRLSYDAASQYFAQAKIIALTGQFISLSFMDVFSGNSLHLTSVYATLIQLFGDQAARLFSWASGLVILAFGWKIGKQVGLSLRGRIIILSILLTSTAFVDMLGDGKIDLASVSVTLASAFWFMNSLRDGKRESFLLTGFLTAYSLMSRPYNTFTLGIFFVSLLISHILSEKESRANFLRRIGSGLLWSSLPVFFWLILNLAVNQAVLHDPLAPLAVFHQTSNDWPFHIAQERMWAFLLFYPFTVTFTGLRDTPGFISPLFVAFMPGIIIKSYRANFFSRKLIMTCLSALVALYAWLLLFGTVQIMEVRYVLFIWALLFLPIASIVDNATRSTALPPHTMISVILATLGFMALRVLVISLSVYSPPTANGQPTCRDLPACTFFEPVNHIASPGDRILVFGAYRYYLRSDLFLCSSTGDEYRTLENLSLQNGEEFWKEIYQQGYRYIVYDSFFVEYILRFRHLSPLQEPPNWLEVSILNKSTFLDFDGRQLTNAIYRIDGIRLDVFPKKACLPEGNTWKVQSVK